MLYLMAMSFERWFVDFFRGDRIMLKYPHHFSFFSFHQWIAFAYFYGCFIFCLLTDRLIEAVLMNLFSFIKQRLPILDVVSEYATLKKAGLYWKGCCPFHHERTPSFSVSPHKEIFYCFGCHTGGDVISFIAKVEHCTPIEAARHLVDRYKHSKFHKI